MLIAIRKQAEQAFPPKQPSSPYVVHEPEGSIWTQSQNERDNGHRF
jgi:hypothetical protein